MIQSLVSKIHFFFVQFKREREREREEEEGQKLGERVFFYRERKPF